MKTVRSLTLLFVCLFNFTPFFAQNETTKWFFGYGAALDFMSVPVTTLSGSALQSYEGSSSIADANGNLLFYTRGDKIWDKTHQLMANGTGLMSHDGVTQNTLLLKQPGSATIYYVFTVDMFNPANTVRYSIVDMSLASGNGSVTVKNATLLAAGATEKITGTHHCNGTDFWIVVHEFGNDVFHSFLLTSSGISPTVVTSTVGSVHIAARGQMKISPLGNKLGITVYNGPGVNTPGGFELCDFDNTTGVVSNALNLNNSLFSPWGVEFSPDGSKLYGNEDLLPILQWDLCAGSNTAIVASMTTVPNSAGMGDLQLAPDGKIYVAGGLNNPFLGVIEFPNAPVAAVNYYTLSLGQYESSLGLPNFIGSMIKTPFTYSTGASCLTASFSSMSYTSASCNAVGPVVSQEEWDFGDPASGSLNFSTLSSPVHIYPSVGNYTVTLVRHMSCRIDTIRRPIAISGPSATFQSIGISCNGLSNAFVNIETTYGPYTHTWMPSGQTSTQITNVSPGIYSLTIQGNLNGCVKTITTQILPPTTTVNLQATVMANNSCSSNNTGVMMTGGSGNYSYLWSPGSFTSSSISSNPPGIYTVTVDDNTYQCSVTKTVQVVQWTLPNLIVQGNLSVCEDDSTTLYASGADTYQWSYVVVSPTISWSYYAASTSSLLITPTINPSYYTVDATNTFVVAGSTTPGECTVSQSFTLNMLPRPSLTVSGNATICPGTPVNLTASGAYVYNWVGFSIDSFLVVAPTISSTYTLIGSAANFCTSKSTVTVTVDDCTGMNENTRSIALPFVYPNPFKNSFTLQLPIDEIRTVFLFNSVGDLIYSTVTQGKTEIDLSKQAKGLYFLRIGTFTTKLIKE